MVEASADADDFCQFQGPRVNIGGGLLEDLLQIVHVGAFGPNAMKIRQYPCLGFDKDLHLKPVAGPQFASKQVEIGQVGFLIGFFGSNADFTLGDLIDIRSR